MPKSSVLNEDSSRSPVTNRLFPEPGDPAPDATLTNTSGDRVTLSSFWSKNAVVLVFLRHFGCPFCRQQVADLRQDYSKFVAAGGKVICIGQGSYKSGKAFEVYFNLPFPVLVTGDDTSVYGKYGLVKGSVKQLFNLHVFLRGFAAIRHGIGNVEGDPTQMPGTFIVDTGGTVRLAFRSPDQATNITTADLLKTLVQMGKL